VLVGSLVGHYVHLSRGFRPYVIIFLCMCVDIIRQVKSRRMRWAGHVARMREDRGMYKVLVGKPEGRRLLERPRCRWEDGVSMDLREIGLGVCGLDSTGPGQGPVTGCCECCGEPSGSCATELVRRYRIVSKQMVRQLGTNG
jgi:hypothetical protein